MSTRISFDTTKKSKQTETKMRRREETPLFSHKGYGSNSTNSTSGNGGSKKVITINTKQASSSGGYNDVGGYGSTGYQTSSMYTSPTTPSSDSPLVSTSTSYTSFKPTAANIPSSSSSSTLLNYSEQTSQSSSSRIGTIKKNYYHAVRETQGTNIQAWLYDVIAEMLQYIYTSISTVSSGISRGAGGKGGEFPQPVLQLDNEIIRRMDEFKTYVSIPYSTENEIHEKELMKLWRICMPHVTLTERVSQQWKQLGFQGTDPATDFRGCGIFGLRNVLYFATNYPEYYGNMFKKSIAAPEAYPFVIAGLNVTMMLFDILGFGLNAKKSHNITARKIFIELLFGSANSKPTNWEENTTIYCSSSHSRTSSTTSIEDPCPEDDWTWNESPTTPTKMKPKKVVESILLDFGEPATETFTNDNREGSQKIDKITKNSTSNNNNNGKKKKATKKKKKKQKELIDKNIVFEELYCCAWRILDKNWYSMNASYFNFPTVLQKTLSRVEDLLETQFTCAEDIAQWNKNAKY